MQLEGYTIRAQVEARDFGRPFVTTLGGTPTIPKGVDLRFELFFKHRGEVIDVANFATLTLSVLAMSRSGAAYMSSSTGTFDNTATQETFDDGTKQHAVFEFSEAETELAATVGGTEYFLVLRAKDASDIILMEAWTRLRVILDGVPEDSTVVQPGNLVPADAEYDGSGEYELTVLDNVFYKWTQGANDDSVDNDGVPVTVSDSNFITTDTLITLIGTPSVAVTAVVRKSPYLTADEVQALIDAIAPAVAQKVFGGTGSPEGSVSATQFSIYTELDGGGDIVKQWCKLSPGTSNTGWQ